MDLKSVLSRLDNRSKNEVRTGYRPPAKQMRTEDKIVQALALIALDAENSGLSIQTENKIMMDMFEDLKGYHHPATYLGSLRKSVKAVKKTLDEMGLTLIVRSE